MKVRKPPLIIAIISIITAPFIFKFGVFGKIVSSMLAVIALILGGTAFMSENIFIKQKKIKANTNDGAIILNNSKEKMELPPMVIEQEKIDAKTNTGLYIRSNPGSGPIKLGETTVKNENMRVDINARAGTVTINPRVGEVRFIYEKKDE